MISWKHSFKRLNEEYEIAKKKKQALDNLFETGRISKATRDSFESDINAVIMEIEKQQKDLLVKMQCKTQELENQIKTLETLLANYEIEHVIGEIDEEMYQREITLISTGLESAKHELDVIKEAIKQLCPPTEAPAAEPSLPGEQSVVAVVPSETVEHASEEQEKVEVVAEPCLKEPVIAIEETAPEEPAIEIVNTPEETPQVVEATSEVIEASPVATEDIPQVVEVPTQETTEQSPNIEETPKSMDETPEVIESTPEVMEALSQNVEEIASQTEIIADVKQAVEEMPQTIEIEPPLIEEIPQTVEGASIEAHPSEAPKEAPQEVTVAVTAEEEQSIEKTTENMTLDEAPITKKYKH